MKKTCLLLSLCSLMLFCSCKKNGVDLFHGDYSFKTSGEITVQRQNTIIAETPTTYTIQLPNEIGQLEISAKERHGDDVVVVINYLNGDVVVTEGFCDGQDIILDEFTHNNLHLSTEGIFDVSCLVHINATGHIYEDKTIVFNMTYRGDFNIDELDYKIKGEEIKMVAYRN